MMDISNLTELTDQQKSDLLCNLADISKDKTTIMGTEGPEWEWSWPDLYEVDGAGNPLFMALSWQVLNWAINPSDIGQRLTVWLEDMTFKTDQNNFTRQAPRWWFIFASPPEELDSAMREVLDKILELAIEAGLVELEEEKE